MSQNVRRNSVAGADSRGAALAEFGHGIPADNHTQTRYPGRNNFFWRRDGAD